MGRTEKLSAPAYANLVRRVVEWVRAQEGCPTYGSIAYRFSLTHGEIDDICADSGVYGPPLMQHAQEDGAPRSTVTVEVLGGDAA